MKSIKIIKKLLILLLQCIAGAEILILIAEVPVLFNKLSFNANEYVHAVVELNSRLFTFDTFYTADGRNSLFPFIFDRYIDSMKMLGLGIIMAVGIGFIVSYLGLFLFRKKINRLKFLLEMIESIPDLMLILLLQFFIIFIFKATGIKLAQVVTVRDEAILLPLISLSVPISCYITKVLIHHIEEEMEKHYVILAKAKGLSFGYILNVHILRNIADGMFGTSKTIFWTMLSTLLVIDYLYNMNGLLRLMLTGTDPFLIGCILIFAPFFILYRIYELASFERSKETV